MTIFNKNVSDVCLAQQSRELSSHQNLCAEIFVHVWSSFLPGTASIPNMARAWLTLSIRTVGLPCSGSRTKRKRRPERRADSTCVKPAALQFSFTYSAIRLILIHQLNTTPCRCYRQVDLLKETPERGYLLFATNNIPFRGYSVKKSTIYRLLASSFLIWLLSHSLDSNAIIDVYFSLFLPSIITHNIDPSLTSLTPWLRFTISLFNIDKRLRLT